MLYFLLVVLLVVAGVYIFLQQPQFGKAPSGERLSRISRSVNYRDGAFQNLSPTPTLTKGYSYPKVLYAFFFKKSKEQKPTHALPSIKTNLKELAADEEVLVWFGHSSYFLRVQGVSFLIDPVFSGRVSPLPGGSQAFLGTDIYGVEDMPPIDYLVLSHDHYDHLDHETVSRLKPKVSEVICGLGVGAHLERWGYAPQTIHEKDWDEQMDLKQGLKIYTHPARHFSGRTFKRNNTLWLSYLLQTPNKKIFLGGDSGYDTHFKKIGEQHGTIDFAILENGQYNEAWHAIHCLPPETVKAAQDLHAKRMMPVHSSKFTLALHAWYAPLTEVSMHAAGKLPLVTPRIGEPVWLDDEGQTFMPWWAE
ncbi:MAG: MBL fold metallo-hydrolase [Cytophagaceae bacterium]|nr:MBL fold metallo-hydrolase [Cytophagaceae bacterium]|tara:strand:+ start:5575 stop:6663 length:1089 start_codon:yes stop_codon:yes gene_type:complete